MDGLENLGAHDRMVGLGHTSNLLNKKTVVDQEYFCIFLFHHWGWVKKALVAYFRFLITSFSPGPNPNSIQIHVKRRPIPSHMRPPPPPGPPCQRFFKDLGSGPGNKKRRNDFVSKLRIFEMFSFTLWPQTPRGPISGPYGPIFLSLGPTLARVFFS